MILPAWRRVRARIEPFPERALTLACSSPSFKWAQRASAQIARSWRVEIPSISSPRMSRSCMNFHLSPLAACKFFEPPARRPEGVPNRRIEILMRLPIDYQLGARHRQGDPDVIQFPLV